MAWSNYRAVHAPSKHAVTSTNTSETVSLCVSKPLGIYSANLTLKPPPFAYSMHASSCLRNRVGCRFFSIYGSPVEQGDRVGAMSLLDHWLPNTLDPHRTTRPLVANLRGLYSYGLYKGAKIFNGHSGIRHLHYAHLAHYHMPPNTDCDPWGCVGVRQCKKPRQSNLFRLR